MCVVVCSVVSIENLCVGCCLIFPSKIKVFVIKVTKHTMWTLIGTSSDTPSFNPFDVSYSVNNLLSCGDSFKCCQY